MWHVKCPCNPQIPLSKQNDENCKQVSLFYLNWPIRLLHTRLENLIIGDEYFSQRLFPSFWLCFTLQNLQNTSFDALRSYAFLKHLAEKHPTSLLDNDAIGTDAVGELRANSIRGLQP